MSKALLGVLSNLGEKEEKLQSECLQVEPVALEAHG